MKKENCLFCNLANGVFATNTVYEDENFDEKEWGPWV